MQRTRGVDWGDSPNNDDDVVYQRTLTYMSRQRIQTRRCSPASRPLGILKHTRDRGEVGRAMLEHVSTVNCLLGSVPHHCTPTPLRKAAPEPRTCGEAEPPTRGVARPARQSRKPRKCILHESARDRAVGVERVCAVAASRDAERAGNLVQEATPLVAVKAGGLVGQRLEPVVLKFVRARAPANRQSRGTSAWLASCQPFTTPGR